MQSFSDNILCEEDSRLLNQIAIFLKENYKLIVVIIGIFIFILISGIIGCCVYKKRTASKFDESCVYEEIPEMPYDEDYYVIPTVPSCPPLPPPSRARRV